MKSCLVHYGIIDPDDKSKVLEVPFCAMNTIHRQGLEEKHIRADQEARKAEEIQSEIEEYLETHK